VSSAAAFGKMCIKERVREINKQEDKKDRRMFE
jgi:hypothetical protein